MSWFKKTDASVLRDEVKLLKGKLYRAEWAMRNGIGALKMFVSDGYEWMADLEKRRYQLTGKIEMLQKAVDDVPLETDWVPRSWYDRAQGDAARAVRWIEKNGEITDELRAVKEENERLRDEVEALTTGRQRISYSDSLRSKEREIRALKDQIKKKNEFIRSRLEDKMHE